MDGSPSGCPCGGVHAPPQRRRVRRQANPELRGKLLPAQWAGKAHQDAVTGIWQVAYHGDCKSPPEVRQHSPKGDLARYSVRCRKCGSCRRAMRNYWGYAAQRQTLEAHDQGLRTWFGTLTLAPDAQAELLLRAMKRSKEPSAEWWKVPDCEERYKRVCAEFLREVQKYWKRLRNSGHAFKYIVVFEPHTGGGKHHALPHAHFLLHEQKEKILKRDLRSQWLLGHFAASLVGGTAARAAAPEKAAWYVVKYLSKAVQTRVRASRDYKPEKRPKDQRPLGRDHLLHRDTRSVADAENTITSEAP